MIKKSLCTCTVYCNRQVHRDFFITLYNCEGTDNTDILRHSVFIKWMSLRLVLQLLYISDFTVKESQQTQTKIFYRVSVKVTAHRQ